MENIINSKLNNNKILFNLVADKGYIKNDNYINNIKNNNNITLIERSKVEHFFSLLKRGYKRISIINDKTLINYSLRPKGSRRICPKGYNNFLNIAISLISLKIIIRL